MTNSFSGILSVLVNRRADKREMQNELTSVRSGRGYCRLGAVAFVGFVITVVNLIAAFGVWNAAARVTRELAGSAFCW